MTTVTHRTAAIHERFISCAAQEAANFRMEYFGPEHAEGIRMVEDRLIASAPKKVKRVQKGPHAQTTAMIKLSEKRAKVREREVEEICAFMATEKSAVEIQDHFGRSRNWVNERVRALVDSGRARVSYCGRKGDPTPHKWVAL